MSEATDRFQRATAHFGDLVHKVSADQWGNPTPCAEWDVKALVNHLVYEARWAPPMLAGRTIAEVGDQFEGDLLGADPETAYDEALKAAANAMTAPGALENTVHLSYGDNPANEYIAQMACDFVVHSWDLARGISADDTLDPDMVQWVDDVARPQAAMLEASGMFGKPIDVPADADPQTKLLALFGRQR